ncbi:hypothetical protein KIW84_044363 [Lathyrus oleraceus]|uniref:Uncharacterized protein n=1 Tax=Pisum sativum TaxID=3888 RepID=A0A9D4XI97_PEA|nr:hypothetical protein KIW84_044363 [Pisum sativum]
MRTQKVDGSLAVAVMQAVVDAHTLHAYVPAGTSMQLLPWLDDEQEYCRMMLARLMWLLWMQHRTVYVRPDIMQVMLELWKKIFDSWSCHSFFNILRSFRKWPRRETDEKDVAFKVLYCEICHSDLHMVKNEWGVSTLPLEAAEPLLCAGITVYSPLRYFGLHKPGLHVGVVGLGGLGHMVVKYAIAFGANVTSHGKLVMVGAPDKPLELPVFPLLQGRKLVAGSAIGGLKETQEMIDFFLLNTI